MIKAALSTPHALMVVTVVSLLGCATPPGVREVTIRAHDYAFEGPDSLPAGPVAFGFINAGMVPHEMVIAGLRPGATLAEVLRRDQADSTWRHLRYPASGLLTADSGVTTPGRLLVNLEAGRTYLLLCNFQDSDTSTVHFHKGMARLIRAY
ncbi:MAG: hypothetical protein HOP28_14725 [Gemmatimonadales bacterium]|nr:hypothetical protein [Gemmatimonadales bacterium]